MRKCNTPAVATRPVSWQTAGRGLPDSRVRPVVTTGSYGRQDRETD